MVWICIFFFLRQNLYLSDFLTIQPIMKVTEIILVSTKEKLSNTQNIKHC